MRRTTVLGTLVAAVVLVAAPAAGLATDNASSALVQTDSANETAPGEQLSGVVGVGGAEMEGDLDRRAFGLQLANASTQQAQADVVADRVTDIDQRLDELEDRKEKLARQREAGEISDGRYNAEMARLAADTETLEDLSNQSARVAGELPADLLEDRGVNATKIRQLSERAGELSGPEVAEIARGIAGDRVGDTPGGDRPIELPDRPGDDRGDRPDASNRSDDDRQGNQSNRP